MIGTPLSVRARVLARGSGVGAVVVCLLIFILGGDTGSRLGLVTSQAAFDALLGLAAVTCLLAFLLQRGRNRLEARLWAALTIAVTLLFAAEVYYSAYQVLVDVSGPPSPSMFDALSALAAIAYVALMWSMSRLRVLPVLTRGRLVSGMAGQMVIVFALLLWGVARPLAAGVPHTFADPILWVAYMCIGLTLIVGAFSDVFGLKVRSWSAWEGLTAGSLVLLGITLVLWPYWIRAAAMHGGAERYHISSLLLASSYGLLFLGALHRVTAPERAWRKVTLPPPDPAIGAVSRTAVSTAQALAIPIFGVLLYRQPVGSPDRGLLLGLIFFITLSLVMRTSFLSIETLQARLRTSRDTLTGALRRSHFVDRLDAVLDEAEVRGESVCLAVFDLDDFARTNMIQGHAVGDDVLASIGSAVQAMLGSGDLFGRLGGDEFALCLRATDLENGMQRLRREHIVLNGAASAAAAPVTLSMGVAVYPDQALGSDDLLCAADGALYWAKYGGKNRVIAYSDAVMHALDAKARLREIDLHSRLEVVRALAAATDARDPATAYHSRNVAALVVLLASAMGLDPEMIRNLELAATVHDVGKIAVPDSVLRKRGWLSSAERELLEEHARTGEAIIASTEFRDAAGWVRSHHEHWDGSGYPDGLSAEAIPVESRIIAVCDAYDTMVCGGPERSAVSRTSALQEIDQAMGSLFDPAIAEQFIQAVAAQPSLGWVDEWAR